MRLLIRVLAVLLMPVLLMGMGVRTGATIAKAAFPSSLTTQEAAFLTAGDHVGVHAQVQADCADLLGPETAELVEEELREVGKDRNADGTSTPVLGASLRSHVAGLLWYAGRLIQPSPDSMVPSTEVGILFSVFRL